MCNTHWDGLWCSWNKCILSLCAHGLQHVEAQSRSWPSVTPPCRLPWVHQCCMSGTALWVKWHWRTSKTDFQQVREKLFWHFKWNTSVSNPHWPLMCLLGFVARGVDPEGLQQIGSNPWSPWPKLISHVAQSAWVTDLKDRNFLYHLPFHLFQLCYFPVLAFSVQQEITDILTYSTSRPSTITCGTFKSCLEFCCFGVKHCSILV